MNGKDEKGGRTEKKIKTTAETEKNTSSILLILIFFKIFYLLSNNRKKTEFDIAGFFHCWRCYCLLIQNISLVIDFFDRGEKSVQKKKTWKKCKKIIMKNLSKESFLGEGKREEAFFSR